MVLEYNKFLAFSTGLSKIKAFFIKKEPKGRIDMVIYPPKGMLFGNAALKNHGKAIALPWFLSYPEEKPLWEGVYILLFCLEFIKLSNRFLQHAKGVVDRHVSVTVHIAEKQGFAVKIYLSDAFLQNNQGVADRDGSA